MGKRNMEKLRTYQREWMRNRRAEWLAGKVCAHCGATDNLELDHIDPTQKVTHAIWSWSYDRRMEELAKCQALCTKCHLVKTISESRKTHCIHGHSLDDADINAHGRSCRTCRILRHRRARGNYSTII